MNSSDLSKRGKLIVTKIKNREALTQDDLNTICDIIDASERRAILYSTISLCVLTSSMVVISAMEYFNEYSNSELNAILYSLPAITLLPIVFRHDNCRTEIERGLKCKECRKPITGLRLQTVASSPQCPSCTSLVSLF